MKISFWKLIFIFGIYIATANAEDFSIRFGTGYNFFNMTDLQQTQRIVNHSMNNMFIRSEIVEEFPEHYYYNLQLAFHFNDHIAGVFLDHTSTGGRVHYQDYSGEYKFDQIVSLSSFGLLYENESLSPSKTFVFFIKAFYASANLENSEILSVGPILSASNSNFETSSIGIDPGFAFQYPFFSYFARLELSYRLIISNYYHLDANDQAFLTVNDKKVNAQWSGFRIGISIGLRVKK